LFNNLTRFLFDWISSPAKTEGSFSTSQLKQDADSLDLAPASEPAVDVNAGYCSCAFDAATFRGIASVPWGLTKSAASLSNFARSIRAKSVHHCVA
jgi:hypothetical protein